jgi:N-acetylglutamate synthase-like GNAT family acetyltransferase
MRETIAFQEIIGQLCFQVARLADVVELSKLINGAYRGEKALRSWTNEAALLDGQRIDTEMLTAQIQRPKSVILKGHRLADPKQGLIGCVAIESLSQDLSYLGMLTVNVDEQRNGFGDAFLKVGEVFARGVFHAERMRMTVLMQRPELIQWYERRGYVLTGEEQPFPYGDERFGKPRQVNLKFAVLEKQL